MSAPPGWSWYRGLRLASCWEELSLGWVGVVLFPGRTLGSLSADGWGSVFTLFLVWPGASQHWQPRSAFPKLATSKGVHTNDYSLGPLPPVSFLHSEPQLPPAFPGGSPRQQVGLAQIFMGACFALGPVHCENLHIPSKKRGSVFPIPMELLLTCLAGFQCQMLWGLLFPMPVPPGVGTWLGVQNSHSCGRASVILVILKFVSCPPSLYGIAYVAKALLLLSHCVVFFVFGCRISFLGVAS